MSYILGVAVLVIFFVVLHYFTEFEKEEKIKITVALAVIIGSGIAYNSYTYAQRAHITKVELQYAQNRTFECSGVEINNKTFSYSVGTQVFIGKKNTPNFERMIPISECK
ncbi:MAG: hypothetical protein GQ570_02090 [Helicobacteraceae bacterium]|nr:hypothetical protein [Helicobacteraceae bacterium]